MMSDLTEYKVMADQVAALLVSGKAWGCHHSPPTSRFSPSQSPTLQVIACSYAALSNLLIPLSLNTKTNFRSVQDTCIRAFNCVVFNKYFENKTLNKFLVHLPRNKKDPVFSR